MSVHNAMRGARELIEACQKITTPEECKAIIEQAHKKTSSGHGSLRETPALLWVRNMGTPQNLDPAQREMGRMVLDFKGANRGMTPAQLLRSHRLDQARGLLPIKALFGNLGQLLALAEEAKSNESTLPSTA